MNRVNLPAVKRVDFYYDFSCPYAYLAQTQIEGTCARTDAKLVWQPVLLGGIFRAVRSPFATPSAAPVEAGSALKAQQPAPAMSAAKALLNELDMARWAEHFGVELRRPASHPCRTVLALRAVLASSDIARSSKAMFRAYWSHALDLSKPDVVRDALDEAGFDGSDLLLRADDPVVKEDLRARTEKAVAAGVFGAPTFIVTAPGVSGAVFWGQDRLIFVEKALGGWNPAPLAVKAVP